MGGDAEIEADEIKKKNKFESLNTILGNPNLAITLSPKWTVQQLLRIGAWEEEEIRVGMDIQNEGDQEIMAEAAEENQKMMQGKEVKVNKGATTSHVKKHIDFVQNNEVKMDIYMTIMRHAQEELPIAQENMARKATGLAMAGGALPPRETKELAPSPQEGAPNIPSPTASGAAQRSQEISQTLMPTK